MDGGAGDKVASMVRWLREMAAEVGQATASDRGFEHHWALHLRYSGDLLRACDKARRTARRAYRAEAAGVQRGGRSGSSCSLGQVLEGKRRREMTCRYWIHFILLGEIEGAGAQLLSVGLIPLWVRL